MKYVLLLTIVIIAIVGAYFLSPSTEKKPSDAKESVTRGKTAVPVGNDTRALPDGEVHPLSLESLFEKKFDGRDLRLERILEENSAYTRYYVTYRSGQLSISGIMNIPKGTPPDGGWPVLVLCHGYIDPAIYTNGRGLRREQDYLARAGFAVIHPDYRGHAESSDTEEDMLAKRLGYVDDVINAVYALRTSHIANLNTGKIGLLGHSMGGGVVQTIAVVAPELTDAAVLYAPVSMDYRDTYERWLSSRPEAIIEISETYGTPEDAPEFWDSISAITYADRITEPLLYFHGTNDVSVPIEWTRGAVERLRSMGKNVEYVEYPGEGHEYGPRWDDFMVRTRDFFRTHLTDN